MINMAQLSYISVLNSAYHWSSRPSFNWLPPSAGAQLCHDFPTDSSPQFGRHPSPSVMTSWTTNFPAESLSAASHKVHSVSSTVAPGVVARTGRAIPRLSAHSSGGASRDSPSTRRQNCQVSMGTRHLSFRPRNCVHHFQNTLKGCHEGSSLLQDSTGSR